MRDFENEIRKSSIIFTGNVQFSHLFFSIGCRITIPHKTSVGIDGIKNKVP